MVRSVIHKTLIASLLICFYPYPASSHGPLDHGGVEKSSTRVSNIKSRILKMIHSNHTFEPTTIRVSESKNKIPDKNGGRLVIGDSDSLAQKPAAGKKVNILVHGTFGTNQVYNKDDKAFGNPENAYGKNVSDHLGGHTVSFQWDGKLSMNSRRSAGNALATHIESYRNKGYDVNILTYSHGGNVAAYALQKLKSKDSSFNTGGQLITIARPLGNRVQVPKDSVKMHVNVYSSKDMVQPMAGMLQIGSARQKDRNAEVNINAPGVSNHPITSHHEIKNTLFQIMADNPNFQNSVSSPENSSQPVSVH